MTRGMEEAEKSLKELEKEITCFICQEHYTQPKVLPCIHYYCEQCILKLALRTGKDKPFSFPECRNEATLPGENEDNLQTAFFVNRFKALYDKQARALSIKEVKCNICTNSQDQVKAFFLQCDKFICGDCIRSHQRMKAFFNGHEILSLDEVKKARAKNVLIKRPVKKCQLHDELLKIYIDCSQLICRDFTLKDHKDHYFEFYHIVVTNKRKELKENLKPLREVEASLSLAMEEIQVTEDQLVAQGESVANKIVTSFEEFHTIIEKSKQQMLEEARRKVSEKLQNIQGQKKKMSISCVVVQSIVNYTEQCVKHCSDDEVMCMQAEIGSRFKREIEKHDKSGMSLAPVEEVDVGVELCCAQALEQLFQTESRIARPPFSLVINKIFSNAEVRKLSGVFFYTTKLSKMPAKLGVKIDYHLKYLRNGSLIKYKSKKIGADQYRIQFIPTLRGRYKLIVSVDGKRVAGDPLPVFVSVLPTQLGQPIKVWDGVT